MGETISAQDFMGNGGLQTTYSAPSSQGESSSDFANGTTGNTTNDPRDTMVQQTQQQQQTPSNPVESFLSNALINPLKGGFNNVNNFVQSIPQAVNETVQQPVEHLLADAGTNIAKAGVAPIQLNNSQSTTDIQSQQTAQINKVLDLMKTETDPTKHAALQQMALKLVQEATPNTEAGQQANEQGRKISSPTNELGVTVPTMNNVKDLGVQALNAAGGIGTVAGAEQGVGAAADAVSAGVEKAGNAIGALKESISPSLTPEEQVGKIIQGKTGDIPAAQRTFNSLPSDVNPAKMAPNELSDAIQTKINSNMNEVDTHFANDNTPHPMSDFEQTTGTGKNAVKTNYVQQAIDQLKDFYTKTNDAQGLSDMKALEEKANTDGLTSKELNDLAKEHGSTISGFNANGEAASGLSKQAAENTRTGLKTTARNILSETNPEGATQVTKLDKETSDAIHTKDLVDKQAEKANTSVQKNGKPSAVSKWTKAHPIATKLIKVGAGMTIGKKLGGVGGEVAGGVAGGL